MGDLHIKTLAKCFYLSHVKGPTISLEQGQNLFFCPVTHTHTPKRKRGKKKGLVLLPNWVNQHPHVGTIVKIPKFI